MAEFTFTCAEARKHYEEKLSDLKKIIDNNEIDNKFLWDKTVEKYGSKISKIQKIFEKEEIAKHLTSKLKRDMDLFIKSCSDPEFHIALVGAIKAGKSTLINALLGHEYASTKVTPETAALTKFKKGESNYVKVSFYSQHEWELLWKSANDTKATVFLEEYQFLNADSEKSKWLDHDDKKIECDSNEDLVNEIYKWTSSKSLCHYFVKEVVVGLKEFDLPTGVVLVDTPGLDDVVEYRSDITRHYIDRANAVLVCVKSDALTGPELATITNVFSNTRSNPQKVYVIATQVDSLNRPKENWEQQNEEWLKYLKGKSCYASIELAKKNLIPVSAYLYTLLKKYNDIAEDSDEKWDLNAILLKLRVKDVNENYKDLLNFTKIDLLKTKIQQEIVQNYMSLLIDDIKDRYEMCKETISETMLKIKTEQENFIQTSQSGIEAIKQKQAEDENQYNKVEQYKAELERSVRALIHATTKRVDELEAAIKQLANNID